MSCNLDTETNDLSNVDLSRIANDLAVGQDQRTNDQDKYLFLRAVSKDIKAHKNGKKGRLVASVIYGKNGTLKVALKKKYRKIKNDSTKDQTTSYIALHCVTDGRVRPQLCIDADINCLSCSQCVGHTLQGGTVVNLRCERKGEPPNPPLNLSSTPCAIDSDCSLSEDGTRCLNNSCRCGCTTNSHCTFDPNSQVCATNVGIAHQRNKCTQCIARSDCNATNYPALHAAFKRFCVASQNEPTNPLTNKCSVCDPRFNRVFANRAIVNGGVVAVVNGGTLFQPNDVPNNTPNPNPSTYPSTNNFIASNIGKNGCLNDPANIAPMKRFCYVANNTNPSQNQCVECLVNEHCRFNVVHMPVQAGGDGKTSCDTTTHICELP